jgi:hypothetical protein
MRKIVALSFALLFMLPLLNSCKKVEGEGGSSKIKGILIERKYNSVGTLLAEYPAMDKNVYIVYGNENTFPNDDVKTSYDGSYEFNYLQPGKYQLFTYEECNTCASGEKAVLLNVEIVEKKSTLVADTMYIKNF